MYKIKLPNFEGPFDLLLYFIKRDEINIYDIPIAKITQEFLNYIRIMQIFDLELAGEFLVMASTLMYIKTQMLLPRGDEDDEDAEDPRTELVQRLLEYKQMKSITKDLSVMADDQRYIYYRELFDADQRIADETEEYRNASIFDLLKAFKNVIDRKNFDTPEHVVSMERMTVSERSKQIMELLQKKKRVTFFNICENGAKDIIVVTFLSLLELIRSRKIFITQNDVFDDIVIGLNPNLN